MTGGLIVVGWDGSPAAGAAAHWATRHAVDTGRDVVLVHPVSQDPLGGGAGDPDRAGRSPDEAVLAELRLLAADTTGMGPGHTVEAAADEQEPVIGLLQWSSRADLLVLGADRPRHTRLMGGLADHLAAVAYCPVAHVPAAFSHRRQLPIVVGAGPTPAGRGAVQWAAAEAARSGSELRVIIAAERFSATGRARLAEVQHLTAGVAAVTIDWVPDPENVADALISPASRPGLVVVGCRRSTDRWSIRLGPVVDAVLTRALCPVVTVGGTAHTSGQSAQRQDAGQPVELVL